MKKQTIFYSLCSLILSCGLFLAGCAPLLIAGGAVGGYAIAKNASDDSSAAKKK